jgi:outer membrane protein OmpA-like peptidoglycan-associated protein
MVTDDLGISVLDGAAPQFSRPDGTSLPQPVSASPHELVDAFLLNCNPALRDRLADSFEPLYGAMDEVRDDLRANDVLVRAAIGEGHAMAVSLVDGELCERRAAQRRGWELEGTLPGRYTLVTDERPIGLVEYRFARRITDSHGIVPTGQAVLRPKTVSTPDGLGAGSRLTTNATTETPGAAHYRNSQQSAQPSWDATEMIVGPDDLHEDDVELIDVGPRLDTERAFDISGGAKQDYGPGGGRLPEPEDPARGIQPEPISLPTALRAEDLNGFDVPMTLPPPNPPRPDPRQEKCRETWQTHHDKLPPAIQTALSHKLYPLAVGLAIHGGLRDADLLTDMVFMTEYGPRRGYCPLTSAEEPYVHLWRDILNNTVLPRLAMPSPPLAQAGGIVCVARKDRRIAHPAPDNPAFDVTGHYEPRVTGGAPPYVFRINQAGRHVEAVLTTVILPMGTVKERLVYRYHGDLQSDGSYLLFNRTKPDQRVSLRRDAQTGSVSLDTAGTIERLDLVGPVPTLMETTLDYLPVINKLVRHHEWFPLTRIQVRHIIDSLSPSKIEPYLRRYFDTPAGDLVYQKADLRHAARPLDDYLDKVFNDDKVGIHYVDRPLAVAYAQTILSESRWKHNLMRSHLDWIQIILNMVAQGATKGDFQGIQTHLGLHPGAGPNDPAAPQHMYRVTLKLTGGGIFLSGYTGTITFEKTNAPFWPESSAWPKGKASFGIRLGGLDSGADISIGSEIEGSATTSQAWQPPDIPGTVSMVKGGIGVPGVGADAGFLHINGSEVFPPMSVVFSDVGFKSPTSVPKSRKDLIPIPDLGGFWGTIQAAPFPDIDYTTVHINPDKTIDSELTEDVHFCLDGATLTEDARQALRIMCANELAGLMSRASRLTINGHTDRSDTDQRNLELSTMRAENTFQAIKDILADNLRIPRSHTVVSGKGETDAIHDKRPDGERNPKYRRVDVILDGRLVLALRAQ